MASSGSKPAKRRASTAKKQASTTSAAQAAVADAPSPGGSDLHAAEVEKVLEGAAKQDPLGDKAHPTAVDPSPGGSDMHAEAVRKELGERKPKGAKSGGSSSPSKTGAQVTLRGRFPAGTTVQLVKVAGPHVLRTTPGDEVVDEKTVDENGHVQFSKGVEKDGRYFARGYVAEGMLEIRLRGRPEADDNDLLANDPVGYDEVRTRDGRVFGTRGHRLAPPDEQ